MENNPQKGASLWKILVPAAIGTAAIAWMIASESEGVDRSLFSPTAGSCAMLLTAFLFMALRDTGYMIRIRVFSGRFLSWKQAFRVIMLWEFTSAVTPSSVGGSAVATVFVHKEGLPVGKSAAMVILTAFMDEMFFVAVFPVAALAVGYGRVFALDGAAVALVAAGYSVKLLLASALAYGLFFNPEGLRKLTIKIFSLPGLRRWRKGAEHTGDDIVLSSAEIKGQPVTFWLKSAGATALSWCSRFLVANAVFSAFFALSDQVLVFVRQMAMWIPMIIAPTPGGSGFAEYIFTRFLSDVTASEVLTPASTVFVALLWRLVTYYPYLLIGAFIIPKWFATKFSRK